MSITKTIKFYLIEPQPCLHNIGLSPAASTYSYFLSAFPCEKYYEFKHEDKNYSFDIIDYSENYMFGTCAKDDNIRYSSFIQTRDRKTKKTKPYSSLSSGEQLEAYTYFFIDFKTNRMASITNQKISAIHILISEYICSKSGNTSIVKIAPEKVADLKKYSDELNSRKWLELEYSEPYGDDNIPNIKTALGQDFDFSQYHIKVKIEKSGNSFIDRLLKLKSSPNTRLTGMKLTGKNNLGLDETINFFEAIYAKTVPLELTDDTVVNTNHIKEKLKETLNSHLSSY